MFRYPLDRSGVIGSTVTHETMFPFLEREPTNDEAIYLYFRGMDA